MGGEETSVMFGGGRELDVILVAGAEEFLTRVLDGAPRRSAEAALRVVNNVADRPLVAVLIGSQHAGFLACADAQDLLPALAVCEQHGEVARASGVVIAPLDDSGKVALKVSLAEPYQLLGAPLAGVAPVPPRQWGSEMSSTLQTDLYCPGCGLERERKAATCRCGHIFDRGAATVVGNNIVGMSPMILPLGCAKCGKNATDGRRLNKTLFTCPIWLIPVFVFTLLGGLIVYLVVRKQLQLNYSLCGDCARSLATKKWIAVGAWVLFAAVLFVSMGLASVPLLIVAGAVFVAAVVASFLAQPPLRLGGHKDGLFTVKGAGRDFLARFAGSA
jgi:hypothetical protein